MSRCLTSAVTCFESCWLFPELRRILSSLRFAQSSRDISARSTSSAAVAGANGIACAAASSVSLATWSLCLQLPSDGKPRSVSSARRLSRIWEKTARRVARSLRSLHIKRAVVCPFSASSVVFPRRLCNGGEHSSPCASPEAPCRSARSPYRSLPGPSSPALGAAERFLRVGRLAAPARPAPASFRRIIRSPQAPTE